MSINHVNIVPAEEQYAPPEQMIELAVVGDAGNPERPMVILSLVEYDETNERTIATRKMEFPAMYLEDVVRGLGAFAVAGQALHLSHGIPFQLPTNVPADESA